MDADDLLDHPAEVIEKYCRDVGIEYTPAMLKWGDEECQKRAEGAFEKWKGFHEDALGSTELKPRVGGAVCFFYIVPFVHYPSDSVPYREKRKGRKRAY